MYDYRQRHMSPRNLAVQLLNLVEYNMHIRKGYAMNQCEYKKVVLRTKY